MGTRTVRILGHAYAAAGDVSIIASMNGTEIYNGPVPTKHGVESNSLPVTDTDVLFEFEILDTINGGVIPTIITVSGGELQLVTYAANKTDNTDFDKFVSNWETDVKTDIVIDGEPLEKNPSENTGTWHILIEDGSTVSMNWHLRGLPYGVPGNERGPDSIWGPPLGPPTRTE